MSERRALTDEQKALLKLVAEGEKLMRSHMAAQAEHFDRDNPQAVDTLGNPLSMEYLARRMTHILDKDEWNFEDVNTVCSTAFMLSVAFRKGLREEKGKTP